MNFKSYILTSLLLMSTFNVYAKENRNCGQADRQFSVTTAHTIAALLCNLHANNASEKLSRTSNNSLNFIHKWNVVVTKESFVVNGICSTALRFYDRAAETPLVVHPGFKMNFSLPRLEDKCDPSIKGTFAELYLSPINNNSFAGSIKNMFASTLTSLSKRDIVIHFKDTGAKISSSGEYTGGRSLVNLNLGFNLISMLRSGFSGGSMNEGATSDNNQLAIGKNLNFDEQIFSLNLNAHLIPNFTLINSTFQFNKATDASLANRDILNISGLKQSELYIRQNGATNAYDDQRLSSDFEGGTSAFYLRKNENLASKIEMVGCTDYSYSGDYNLAQSMKVSDCQKRINLIRTF